MLTTIENLEEEMGDHLGQMKCDVGEENIGRTYVYDSLKFDLEQQSFSWCSNFTQLLATLKLFYLKTRNEYTNRSFTCLLEFSKKMLPKDNTLPNLYITKKIVCLMSLMMS